jgi:hypothetical protein
MRTTTQQVRAVMSKMGKRGGKAAAERLTPEQRRARASKAARAMHARRKEAA